MTSTIRKKNAQLQASKKIYEMLEYDKSNNEDGILQEITMTPTKEVTIAVIVRNSYSFNTLKFLKDRINNEHN